MNARGLTPLTALCALVLAACGGGQDEAWLGYVEGDFLRLGPRDPGLVTSLDVREGDTVAAGAALFSIDAERAYLGVMQADAQVEAAYSRVDDLQRGGRPEEIAVAEQQLEQARAELTLAEQNFERTRQLVEDQAAAEQRLDEDRRAVVAARAGVREAENRLALARQPAREDQITTARREAEGAQAALAQAQEALDQRTVAAPKAGLVDRIYLREGEYAAPGAPVLSLLPPDNLKIVFFAPEPDLASLPIGAVVSLTCDSCPEGLEARVSRAAAQAEFAPPVIYSEDARARLVYRIEARLEEPVPALKPGQPVEIRAAP